MLSIIRTIIFVLTIIIFMYLSIRNLLIYDSNKDEEYDELLLFFFKIFTCIIAIIYRSFWPLIISIIFSFIYYVATLSIKNKEKVAEILKERHINNNNSNMLNLTGYLLYYFQEIETIDDIIDNFAEDFFKKRQKKVITSKRKGLESYHFTFQEQDKTVIFDLDFNKFNLFCIHLILPLDKKKIKEYLVNTLNPFIENIIDKELEEKVDSQEYSVKTDDLLIITSYAKDAPILTIRKKEKNYSILDFK